VNHVLDPFTAVFGEGRGTWEREPEPGSRPVSEERFSTPDEELAAFTQRLRTLTGQEAARIAGAHAAAVSGQPERVDEVWRVARDIALKVPRISARWDAGWDAAVAATPKHLWDELEQAVRDGVMAVAMSSILSSEDLDVFYRAWR
jgi:hypothetical protein